MKKDIPFWEKISMTLEEASAYSSIGVNKLREITDDEKCPFVMYVGSKRLVKRKLFENYIDNAYSI